MPFTTLLAIIVVIGLVHLLITRPTVGYIQKRGYLIKTWQQVVTNIGVPLLLFITLGTAIEIAEEQRRQDWAVKQASEKAELETKCGPAPSEGLDETIKHALCLRGVRQ